VKRVGLTGNIAAGKSTVGAMFVDEGCRLIDSDRITHELLVDDVGVCDAVVRAFGTGVLDPNGRIDRKKLGAIVFSDPEHRKTLTDILHPVIFVRQQAFLEASAQSEPDGIAIVDAALMVETGNARRFDCLIVVTCRLDQQRSRLEARGLTGVDIDARIAAQMPMAEKAAHADIVIDNSGTLDETRAQVVAAVRQLKSS